MRLILGDCEQQLKQLPDNSIDAVITSPPYDTLRKYDALTFEKFQTIAQQIKRVIKPGAVCVWVVGDAVQNGSETGTSFKQALYFKEIGLNIHDTMIYHSEKPPLTHNRYEQKFEYMFVFSKGKPKTFNGLREPSTYAGDKRTLTFRHDGANLGVAHTPGGKAPTKLRGNVWKYAIGMNGSSTDKEAFRHPAIFPEKLAEDHILSWTNENEIVLDPFMGSGTTGKMCKLLNRQFIGIEMNEEYIQIAKGRIGA